ncbi:glycosyltransferase [Vampirovibrio sp.]|uniref:glycosyltransferase n=1 Tax=Vampirovibrio sp. TaxID=2717857 RepID=UPI0035935CA0
MDNAPHLAKILMSQPSPPACSLCTSPVGRRKILFFYQDFGQMGGIERYLLTVGQALLAHDDFEPVFLCSQNTPLYHQLKALGCSVYGVQSPSFFARSFLRSLDMGALRALKQVIDREKPDIVHMHIGLLETCLVKHWGCAAVFTFHGYGSLYSDRWATHPLQRFFKGWVKRIFQKTVNGLDQLLIVSQAEQKRLLAERFLALPHSGHVLHNGVCLDTITQAVAHTDVPALRARLGLRPDSRVIAFVNRLDANKNPAHFLALAERFAQYPDFADCEFIIVGDGPLKPTVAAVCAALGNAQYLGYRTDVFALLALVDVLIYPALAEGFGLGLVEAMAAGVLCLAYASEGAGEILETPQTNDCLVPVGDLDALENRLKAMLNLSVERQQALKTALIARAAEFSLQDSIQKLTGVYQALTPKISILLPVYNGADCVLNAVRSIMNQTYPHWELIIVDDGSTDDTLARLSAFCDELADHRVRVISQRNQGVAMARNFGFAQANGDYIAFIDADDLWLPRKLAEEVAVIRRASTTPHHPACLVYSGYFAVNETNQLINLPAISQQTGNLADAVLKDEGIFLPSTALVHRSVFEAVGGFQPACYHEDRVFFIQACQQFPAYATGKRLVLYRQSLSGRCRSVLKNHEEALSAELSIVFTLQGTLSESQLSLLSYRQHRNLVFRFLMYDYFPSAQHLYQQMRQHYPPAVMAELLQGRKGQLAQFSLNTGINFLNLARLLLQGLLKATSCVVVSPAYKAALGKETR